MKVSGEATLHAKIDEVWKAINDPAVLVRTIPGCERLETTAPDAYRIVVTAGVAAVRGTYAGEVTLHEQQVPTSFVLSASGAGSAGTVRTDVAVTLAEDEATLTRLRYDADAEVGGVIAGVGQRMLAAVAKKLADEFFAAIDDVLTGAALAPAEPAVGSTVEGARTFVAPPRAGQGTSSFVTGAVVGGLIAIAGVLVGRLLGRRP